MEVWASNLEEEMCRVQDLAEEFRHVAMDALLPGIVAQPTGPFGDYVGYNYQTLRCNVDLTRAIQIGLTLSDSEGNQPEGVSAWRFNFFFDAGLDLVAAECVERLRQSCGLNLEKHHQHGIDVHRFGELLMSSGLVLNDDIRWISFCGAKSFQERPLRPQPTLEDASVSSPSVGCLELPWVSFCGMYNFGHLLQLLTSQELPDGVEGFHESLDLFFPSRCDLANHLHRLPQLSGIDAADPQRRPCFCSADRVLEAFFRLPDAVRGAAFDREEPTDDEGAASGSGGCGVDLRHGTKHERGRGTQCGGQPRQGSKHERGKGSQRGAVKTGGG